MKKVLQVQARLCCVVFLLLCGLLAHAQQTSASATNAVPPMVNFGGVLRTVSGKAPSGVVGVTFAIYKEEQGGAPLWLETQNVQTDSHGRYTVLFGSTTSAGLPTSIFTSGEAHWVGVQVQGEQEQPRILLVSAPYALKAGDAETIGGLPASAFVLAAPGSLGGSSATGITASAAMQSSTNSSALIPATSDVTTAGGTVNAIPLFSTATNIQNSLLTQTGTAAINVVGRLNLPATTPATKAAGSNSQPQTFVASAFSSVTSTPVAQTFLWRAEPLGNDTATPSAMLSLLYGEGKTAPVETGLKLSNTGVLTFATGQSFPGTISGVKAGTDLTGGGSTGNVTLNLDTTKVPQLGAANAFIGNQIVTGTVMATSSTGNGVVGNSSSATGAGIVGDNTATTGATVGVSGITASTAGIGVKGQSADVGVYGSSSGASKTGVGHGHTGLWGDTGGAAGQGFYGVVGTADANSGGAFFNNGPYPALLANNFAAAATGVIAVKGQSAGIGVEGLSLNIGIYGATSGSSKTGSGRGDSGVWGDSGAAPGSGHAGVLGTADANSAGWFINNGAFPTLLALNQAATAAGVVAVEGQSTNVGVYGNSLGASTTGVGRGSSGLWGDTGAAAGSGHAGVLGTADANSAGLFLNNGPYATLLAVNSAPFNDTSFPFAIKGESTNIGVYGATDGASKEGQSVGGYLSGVWGDTGGPSGELGAYSGVTGTADEGEAGFFANNSATFPTVFLQNDEKSEKDALIFEALGDNFGGGCDIDVSGDLTCTGALAGAVSVHGGAQKVALYSMQSPENWFEDAGSGQLSNGSVRITLDPMFAQTVNAGVEYHVFLTPNGDSKGLYVSQKTATSFEVHEQGGGASNIVFDYRIMAKRAGYEAVRLADLTRKFSQQAARRNMKRHAVQAAAEPRSDIATSVPKLQAAGQAGR
jgi:hypothetical protein